MAKCELTISLDDSDRVYREGEAIKGVVHVRVDKDVTCNGLDVELAWRTHGRGNVDSGSAPSQMLFSGQWRAGEKLEYPFELQAVGWPPTYFGHYINVEHSVDVRANIPWAFDPKASEPVRVAASQSPETADESGTATTMVVGCIVAFVVLFVSAFAFVFFVPALGPTIGGAIVGSIIASVIGFFVVRRFMVRWTLGQPECKYEFSLVTPGESLKGELLVMPKRNCRINGVSLWVTGTESATSGSGSNRTTASHTVFEQEIELQPSTQLTSEKTYRFPIECPIPEDAPPSFDLGDNKLLWRVVARIDVPRWPDWTDTQSIVILPLGSLAPPVPSEVPDTPPTENITFTETVNQLWPIRDDRESRDLLIQAIAGMTFHIEAIIERRLLYSGDGRPEVYPNGHAVWARFPTPELPMVLYVPHDLGEEFEQMGRQVWKGRGTVLGWDRDHGRLELKVEGL